MVKRGDSPNSGCVEDADLHAALDGELSDAALELVHVHVAGCGACGSRLRAVREQRQQVATLLGQEDEHEGEAVLASVARIERAVAHMPQRAQTLRRPGSILKRLGLAMAAAAGLILAFAWPGSDGDVTAAPGRILDEAMVRENAWMYQPEKVLHWVVESEISGSARLADGRYKNRHWMSTVTGAQGELLRKTDASGRLVFATWRRRDGSVVTYRIDRATPLQVEPSNAEIRAQLDSLPPEERQAAQVFLDTRQQDSETSLQRSRFAKWFLDAANQRGDVHVERKPTPDGADGYYLRLERGPGAQLDRGVVRHVMETYIEAQGFRRYRLRSEREYGDGRLWIEDARWVKFAETNLADFEANTLTDLLASMPATKVTVRQLVQSRMSALTRSTTAQ
ncbi:MAG TPA: zf-HC2 domain-containing protein [Vicinamibacterales bacterium]|nr:zf-HC2 domain-containing protein [Vicinamibacterales bacterium]